MKVYRIQDDSNTGPYTSVGVDTYEDHPVTGIRPGGMHSPYYQGIEFDKQTHLFAFTNHASLVKYFHHKHFLKKHIKKWDVCIYEVHHRYVRMGKSDFQCAFDKTKAVVLHKENVRTYLEKYFPIGA